MWTALELDPLPGERDPEFCDLAGLAAASHVDPHNVAASQIWAVGPSGPVSDAVLARKPSRLCREGAIPPSHRAGVWFHLLLPYHARAADGSCATVAELRAKFASRWEVVAPTAVDAGLLLPPPHFLTKAGVEAAARVLQALARTCDGIESDDGAATGLARFSIVVRQLVAFALMYLPCESDAHGFVQTVWASGASSGAARRRGDDAWHLNASASKVDRAVACVSFARLVRRAMPKTWAAMSAVRRVCARAAGELCVWSDATSTCCAAGWRARPEIRDASLRSARVRDAVAPSLRCAGPGLLRCGRVQGPLSVSVSSRERLRAP